MTTCGPFTDAQRRESVGHRPLVLFHSHCLDGAGAAAAAYMALGDDADYLAVSYGKDPPADIAGRRVYILDFSYPRDVLLKMREQALCVMVIDHHKSAQQALDGLPDTIFDMVHSGAVLAWMHFHGSKEVPQILLHIEDRDLWRFGRVGTREITAGLVFLGFHEAFGELLPLLGGHSGFMLREVRRLGEMALREQQAAIDTHRRHAETVILGGVKCLAANCTRPEIISDLGNALAHVAGGVGILWSGGKDGYQISLRGIGDVDVAKIAEGFGGGGHRSAAGFRCKELPWVKDGRTRELALEEAAVYLDSCAEDWQRTGPKHTEESLIYGEAARHIRELKKLGANRALCQSPFIGHRITCDDCGHHIAFHVEPDGHCDSSGCQCQRFASVASGMNAAAITGT